MSKIFNYWGMRDKVGDIGVVTDRVVMSKRTCSHRLVRSPSHRYRLTVESAYLLGIECWEHLMLQEAGGEFIALYVRGSAINLHTISLIYSYSIQHSHLREMLLETAHELGAETRLNSEVVEIAKDCRSVRLASGEVLEADVIIGADGSQGLCRKLVYPQDPSKATGIMLFKYAFCSSFSRYVFIGLSDNKL